MSKQHHVTKKHDHEHGTTRSYVIGFILSLVFTIIPYYMVVNKTLTGNALLLTILGIAVLQMFIQMFFFLHLGRGPKPLYNVVFFFGTAGIILIVIGASLMIMNNLYHNMTPQEVTVRIAQEENISQVGGEDTGACSGMKENHKVVINNNKADIIHLEAQRCDTLTFINQDSRKREIRFGEHPHMTYGGLFEVKLSKDHPETITLNQSGDFIFVDHLDPRVTAHFTVTTE